VAIYGAAVQLWRRAGRPRSDDRRSATEGSLQAPSKTACWRAVPSADAA